MAADATKEAKPQGDATDGGYTVLARKYRSRTFDEVVGQEHVAQTLKRAIETNRVHHAYLFCGTRGVGKTSMARILALALNDPTSDGPTATPDPATETADAIFKGDDVDVIEIDAASNTGVDNVRDLIENARFRPMRSRFKVYLIDEVHMLSKPAFNALLKIMEEPPSHVKFILATTEPEKILATILSRVQRFDFRDISIADAVSHLREVCEREGVEAEDDALRLVARNGQGSMRDALSLLDRLISGRDEGGGRLGVDDVTRLLGLPPRERVAAVVDAIGTGEPHDALRRAGEILAAGQSADSLVGALIDHLHALLVRRVAGDAAAGELADLPGLDDAKLAEQAARFEPAVLAQDVAILEELRRQMRSSAAGRALLDATLVRLALAAQFTPVADLLAAGDGAATSGRAEKKTADVTRPRSSRPSSQSAPPMVRPLERASDPPAEAGEPPEPEAIKVDETVEPTDAVWHRLREALADHGPLVGMLAAGRLARLDPPSNGSPGRAEIEFDHENARFAGMLEKNDRLAVVSAALGDLLKADAPPAVALRVLDAPPEPPASREQPRSPRPDRSPGHPPLPPAAVAAPAELDLAADPLVQTAIREFGARVVKVEDDDGNAKAEG